MASNFGDLPQELHVQILSNLDAVSLIRCVMTSQAIYNALKSSSLLVYTIQLHLDGLKDGGTSITYPDLIESLVRRRQVWLSPERKEPLTHHTLRDCGAYELVGGAFANSNTTMDCLEIIWVPTSNGVQGRTLQTPSIGISVRDLTMDPTQDLIILLEDNGMVSPATNTRIFPIHIRTISTNTIHPLALQSPLQFTVFPEHMYGTAIHSDTATLQIACNIFALYFRNVSQVLRVLIWDWTTSELILDSTISFDPFLTSLRYDFGLLDSTYFFVTCPSDIELIRLYKLVRSHAAASPAIHLATLHLPPTSPGTTVLSISSHTGPIEANPLPHTLFMINDDDRLHVFTVVYGHHGASRARPFNLFLHQHVLAKYAHHVLTLQKPLDVLWGEWGLQNTMFTHPHMYYEPNYIRYVHGQHCVFPGGIVGADSPMPDPSDYVEVLNFSFAAVLCAKGMLPMPQLTPEGKPGTLVPSRIIRAEDVPFFLDDVETHLPCIISTLDLEQSHDAYMIHADGIIGVNMNHAKANFLLHMYTV